MKNGYLKVAAASPSLVLANPMDNLGKLVGLVDEAERASVKVLVFPELAITGASAGDLFFSRTLQRRAGDALLSLAEATRGKDVLVFVGYPFLYQGRLYDTMAALKDGRILSFTVKTNLSVEQRRWFTPAPYENMSIDGIPFGSFIIHSYGRYRISAGFLNDLYAMSSPLSRLAGAGSVVFALAGYENETVTSAQENRKRLEAESGRLLSAGMLALSSEDESTGEGVASGQLAIVECGRILSSVDTSCGRLLVSEVDVDLLNAERIRSPYYAYAGENGTSDVQISFEETDTVLTRTFDRFPFIPSERVEMEQRCGKILELQAKALKRRVEHTHTKTLVVGLSGGLDSTLALLASVRTMDMLGRSRRDVLSITMPCFGTTKRTKGNAELLAEALGTSFEEIDIRKSVLQHFEDIGHSPDDLSVAYENAQARERTQVLMDKANKCSGLVVGTGDLSELALGWATYNGDHMSMYAVNASIPKTLIRHIVKYVADLGGPEAKVLNDILDTPVSPELLPAKDGLISQRTENIVGPYELHDFFLYHLVRYGFSAGKLFRMAHEAFEGQYGDDEILHWLETFLRRFFSQQFKRNCVPDGPAVGSVNFSPRGSFAMPSDSSSAAWLEEIEAIRSSKS